jgi:hypothetical protein
MKSVYRYHEHLFNIMLFLMYAIYIGTAIGLSIANAPNYLTTLDYYIKLYISLFLIIRFNPFTKTEFTKFDKKVVYNAGVFLLATTTFTSIFKNYFNKVKKSVNNFVNIDDLLK